ncbi:MAG: universal stress protein [Candidatus Polarisedimenticolia bacterium]
MITIRKVLCPSDFSEFSGRALLYGSALSKWYGASLYLLHVVPVITQPPAKLPGFAVHPFGPEERRTLQSELAACASPAMSAGVAVETAVVRGDPVAEILKAAATLPADLLVIGTHGRGGFEHLVLGSVTEKVLRKAVCPVLAVPPQAGPPKAEEPLLFRHILCPVDFSEASVRAVEQAFSLAEETDARITLMHAVEGYQETEEGTPVHLRDGVLQYRDYLRDKARDLLLGLVPANATSFCRPAIEVVAGRAWREILRLCAERGADLIVMGVYGRGPIDRMLFGSTTHQVVRQAPCPVLTIRSTA